MSTSRRVCSRLCGAAGNSFWPAPARGLGCPAPKDRCSRYRKPGDANALAKPGVKCPCLPMPPRREAVRLNTAGRYRRPLRALQAQTKHAPVLQASGSLQGRTDRELVLQGCYRGVEFYFFRIYRALADRCRSPTVRSRDLGVGL